MDLLVYALECLHALGDLLEGLVNFYLPARSRQYRLRCRELLPTAFVVPLHRASDEGDVESSGTKRFKVGDSGFDVEIVAIRCNATMDPPRCELLVYVTLSAAILTCLELMVHGSTIHRRINYHDVRLSGMSGRTAEYIVR